MNISIKDFGKDHWSTFAYIETLCVDSPNSEGVGVINGRRMRCDTDRHPLLVGGLYSFADEKYPTRLREGKELSNHDDWDCLEDLEREGLLEIISLINGFVKLTEKGIKIAGELRGHKARGGTFSTFVPSCIGEKKDDETSEGKV